jgi:hypothetical protein
VEHKVLGTQKPNPEGRLIIRGGCGNKKREIIPKIEKRNIL